MKIISCLLALAACVLFSGCTAIAVRGPVGDPVDDSVVDELVGTWIGERIDSIDSTMMIERVPDSKFLVARFTEGGEAREHRFFPTRIADGTLVLWAETAVDGFLAPGRAILNGGTLVVLIPDNDEVKAFVERGVLSAAPEEHEELFMIEPQGVSELMATKAFWSLNGALAVIKSQTSKMKDGDPAAGGADALPAQPAEEPGKNQE